MNLTFSSQMFPIGYGFPTFVWLRAAPVIVSWFADCTWNNNHKWYA